MPQLRDFLGRFRLAGAPGAAARAGTPADRARELAAEVGPVLALLAAADTERERIIAQAKLDAEQVTATARAEAAVITADAGRRAQAARDEAARQELARAREDTAVLVASATRQASRTRELARERIPGLVSDAVGLIWQLRADDR